MFIETSLADTWTPARPVHRDEAIRMMERCPRPSIVGKHSYMFREDETYDGKHWAVLVRENPYNLLRYGEWFDFGNVPAGTLLDASKDAQPFLPEGFIKPPYGETVFRVRITNLLVPGGTMEIIVCWEAFSEKEIEALKNTSTSHFPNASPESIARMKKMLDVELVKHDLLNRAYLFVAAGEKLHLFSTVMFFGAKFDIVSFRDKEFCMSISETQPDGDDRDVLGCGILLALWNILNTKNIEKRTVEPPPKLQKARAKAGKLPLAVVTYINSSQYERANEATNQMKASGELPSKVSDEPGEHRRSPRMHLRRAHLRRYKSDGHITPIAAMIINADKDPVHRIEYRQREKTHGQSVQG